MGFFDFLADHPAYSTGPYSVTRLNKRHRLMIEPFADALKGTRVLDLAAHDGRWSFAFAAAGAEKVVGVEARQELIDRFALFPDTDYKARVDLRQGDIFEALDGLVREGATFDVVAILGVFYHVIEHFRLLRMARLLGARIILIDSEFSPLEGPVIELVKEDTSDIRNAAPQFLGQKNALVGRPTLTATTKMARALNYDVIWADAKALFADDREGVGDYFRNDNRKRAFCTLVDLG